MAGSRPTAEVHYAALRRYLEAHLLKEQAGVSKQRQSAGEKLKDLTQQHFQELSTDVYDEMSRRLLDSPDVPFLPVRDDFHPKRNQARQKLATLPTNRFKDLASDVFADLQRRYPDLVAETSQHKPRWSSDEQGGHSDGEATLMDYGEKEAEVRSPNRSDKGRSQDRQRRPSELKGSYSQEQSYGPLASPGHSPSPGSGPFSPTSTYAFTSPRNTASAIAGVRRGSETVATTIIPQQQTATLQQPAYTVRKNSYQGMPESPRALSTTDSATSDEHQVAENVITSRLNAGHAGTKLPETSKKPATISIDALISSTSAAAGVALPEAASLQKRPSGSAPREQTSSAVAGRLEGAEVNFASLDSLMADLGSMIRSTKQLAEDQTVSPTLLSAEAAEQPQQKLKGVNANMRRDYEENIDALTRRVVELEEDAKRRSASTSNSQEVVLRLREGISKQAKELRLLKQLHEKAALDVNEYQAKLKDAQLRSQELKIKLDGLSRDFENLRAERDNNAEMLENISEENAQLRKELSGALHTLRTLQERRSENTSRQSQMLPPSFVYVAAVAQADQVLVPQESGVMEPMKLAAYQASVDELLRAARGEASSAILMAMKAVVVACKAITEDLDRFQPPDRHAADRVQALKAGFAVTLGSLLTAAKAHASQPGGHGDMAYVESVNALDANAGSMTATILEFAKLLRVRSRSAQASLF